MISFLLSLLFYSSGVIGDPKPFQTKLIHSCHVQIYQSTESYNYLQISHIFDPIRRRALVDGKPTADFVHVNDLDECVEECLTVPDCTAADYSESQKICTLLSDGIKDGHLPEKWSGSFSATGMVHLYPKCVFEPSPTQTFVELSTGAKTTPAWISVVDIVIYVGKKKVRFCTGILFPTSDDSRSTNVVITSANCLVENRVVLKGGEKFGKFIMFSDSNIWITAGKTNDGTFESGEQHQRSLRFFIHSGFHPTDLDNNVAIIEVRKHFQYSATVQPIRLAKDEENRKVKDKNLLYDDYLEVYRFNWGMEDKTCITGAWCHQNVHAKTDVGRPATYVQSAWKHDLRADRQKGKKEKFVLVTTGKMEECEQGREGSMLACWKDMENRWTLEGLAMQVVTIFHGSDSSFTLLSVHREWIEGTVEKIKKEEEKNKRKNEKKGCLKGALLFGKCASGSSKDVKTKKQQ